MTTEFCKILGAAALAAGIVVLTAAYDAWSNRRKYKAREDQRRAKGGLH